MKEKNKAVGYDEPIPRFMCSYRLGFAILGFIIFLHNNMQRVCISVAIICMVNHTAVRMLNEDPMGNVTSDVSMGGNFNGNGTELVTVPSIEEPDEVQCEAPVGTDPEETAEDGPFVWDKATQGHILGAYFYGYLVAQFPAGWLAERYGPKWPLMIFYSVATAATLLSPVASYASPILLIIFRIIIGFGSGALFPCMHTMWSRWAPPLERSKLAGITYAGCFAAPIVALPLSGVLCQYGFSDGWDSVFYVIGTSSAVVIPLWVVITSSSPADNKRLPPAEKRYIVNSIKADGVDTSKQRKLPWCELLKSGPMWGIFIANFCSDWGFYTMLTNIPTFLNEVLNFDISSNGLISALPFIGLTINVNVSPMIADKLRSTGTLSTTQTRKVFNSIGLLVPAVFLIGLGFVECTNPATGVALLVASVTFSGCAYTGFLVNHMDIGPPFAGTLLGITNGLASTAGFIAPSVVAVLTPNQTRGEWQIFFFITSGLYVIGAVTYIILGSGEIQSWAKDEELMPEELKIVGSRDNVQLNLSKEDIHHKNASEADLGDTNLHANGSCTLVNCDICDSSNVSNGKETFVANNV